MLYTYSEYIINEGASDKPTVIYWNQQLNSVIDKEWSDISSKKHGDEYTLNFKCGEDKNDYYCVVLESKGKVNNDLYYFSDDVNIKKFTTKFNQEFWKNPQEYLKNLKYVPKCLGDVSHVSDSTIFNM